MDPQPNNKHKQQQFKAQKIIAMMRVTKKTDPLFKPLKKLKNALESIGYDKISLTPSKKIVVFHFGLGNDLDLQFLKKTQLINDAIKNNPILPGKSYCYLNFPTEKEAQIYFKTNFALILQDFSAGFIQLKHENLSRVLICLYGKQTQIKNTEQVIDIQDTPYHYVPQTIPGIILIQQFINKQQQIQLLQSIDKGQWSKLNNRRVQHYGYEFKYGRNQIDKDEKYQNQMPQFILKILDRLSKMQILPGYRYDQMTINDYFSGDGIPPHFDTHSPFEQHFVALSMLSGIVMDWRKYDGTQKQVYLLPRSLIIFSGEGRYAWTHGISCRKVDRINGQLKHRSRRISITLRKIKHSPCLCPYYFYCDSQGYDQTTMKKQNPLLLKYLAQNIHNKKIQNKSGEQIYKKYVVEAYNGFGFDFHNRAINTVQNMINSYLGKSLGEFVCILDVGCGNAQYKQVLDKYLCGKDKKIFFHYIGIQICQVMKNFQDRILMDGMCLAFNTGSFDLVLCIAVLHHMASRQQRLKMLRQLHKVAKQEGIIIITVFGYQQKKHIYKNQDILLQYCLSNAKNNTVDPQKTTQITKRKQKRGEIYQRYYHLFIEQQLIQLLKQVNLQIIQLEKDKENIIVMVQKKK